VNPVARLLGSGKRSIERVWGTGGISGCVTGKVTRLETSVA